MNRKEKQLLTDIVYNILLKIPLPAGTGAHTATVKGYTDFGREMRIIKSEIQEALRLLRDGEIEECSILIEQMKETVKEFEEDR